MKDPARLLDHGATSEELSLLRAGLAEEPGIEGKQRLAAALGLGVSAWAASSTASAATRAVSKASAGASTGGKLGVKWLMVLAGGVSVGAAALVVMLGKPAQVTESTPARAVSTSEAKAPQVEATSSDKATTGVAPEQIPSEAKATVEASKVAPASRQGATGTTPAPADSASIAREIEAVDQVRTLVSRGQSSAALSALGKYRKEFPRGVLRQEATLLQIEALAKAGNLARAREIGQRFLREHPRTPHEKRVRALLGDAP